MAITVRQLVETPHLRTRFHSGRSGGEQVINWAHTCEMPDPWHWLEPFDMLMTNGIGLPVDPEDQNRYLSRLADAGISAIAIGEDVGAPPISPTMVSASERRALPILLTAFEVPFAAVARVVADSRTDLEERRRLTKTARIYELLRTATIDRCGAAHLLRELGAELGCHFEVLDLASWREAFAPARRASAAVRDVLRDALARCAGHLPAILRLELDGGVGLAVPVPARRPAALLASRFTDPQPELSVLQHVSTVAALELEKLSSERDALSRAGAELLADLLSVRLDTADALGRLASVNLKTDRLVVAAWRDEECERHAVHQELFARGVPHLLLLGGPGSIALALLPDTDDARAMLLESLPATCCVGLSAEVSQPERAAAATREARWALHSCAPQRSRVARYGTGGRLPWGFTLEGADEIAGHVLGSLVQYDRSHQSELLPTLAALLRNDRSPTRTAAELYIHRQTLVYRVRRIEQLTERSLSRTEDVVELWLAMKALEIVNGSATSNGGG